MTYFWAAVGVLLAVGLGLIIWGSLTGPDRERHDVSRQRNREMQVGAVLVGISLLVLVIAYLTADWP